MAFGYKSDPSRRYAYCVSRIGREAENLLVDQLHKAHRFKNVLVELELARRGRIRAAALAASPRLEALQAGLEEMDGQYEELLRQLTAARSRERDKKAGKEFADRMKVLSKERKTRRKETKEARIAAYGTDAAKVTMAGIDDAAAVAVEAARKEAIAGGLYWATAADVITRVPRTGMPPKFARWTGDGSLAIQFQRKGDKSSGREPILDKDGNPRLRRGKPMTRATASRPMGATQLFEGSPLLKIAPLPARRGDPDSGPSKKWVSIVWRYGSGPKGRPLTVTLDRVAMHRPIPPGATVKWAHLHRSTYGTRSRWEIQFTVSMPQWDPKPAAESGTVAVSLGWRMIDGDLRIGHWIGSDGASGDIVIPARRLGRWRAAADLRSLRDLQFNAMKLRLEAFLSGTEEFAGRPDTFVIPEWFAKEVEHRLRWKTPGRFVRLLRLWGDQRFPGDEAYFGEVTGKKVDCDDGAVRRTVNSVLQDGHLWDWQQFSLRKARRWRKAFFHDLAARLAGRYRRVAVAQIDWHELGKDKPPESDEPDINLTNKGIAAVGMLRDALGARLEAVLVSAVGIAMTCSVCGGVCTSPGNGRLVFCAACGGDGVERVVNAASNLLRRALEPENAEAGPLADPK